MSSRVPFRATEALERSVRELVRDGAIVGIGGQNIGRCAVATATAILRAKTRDLTLVGCNLSLHADLLVGGGAVRRLECGTGNLEGYGVTHRIARAIEERSVEVEDYDHLSMLARFVAGGTGAPFQAVRHLAGTSLLQGSSTSGRRKFALVENPWDPTDAVHLVPALRPDVSIVHAQAADAHGNLLIRGPASHDPELIRASRSVIATVERVLSSEVFDADTPGTVIPAVFVTATIPIAHGAWPTSVFGVYEHDDEEMRRYQRLAKAGGAAYARYVDELLSLSSVDSYC